jgi:hypothetical protein
MTPVPQLSTTHRQLDNWNEATACVHQPFSNGADLGETEHEAESQAPPYATRDVNATNLAVALLLHSCSTCRTAVHLMGRQNCTC